MSDRTINPFDNDAASQWLSDVVDEDSLELVQQTLEAAWASPRETLACDDAQRAIAASELLALLRGSPSPYVCEDLRHWAQSSRLDVPDELLEMADTVLLRILGPRCELRALWEEAGHLDVLVESIESLRARLQP